MILLVTSRADEVLASTVHLLLMSIDASDCFTQSAATTACCDGSIRVGCFDGLL